MVFIREAFEALHHGQQDVLGDADLELVHHPQPEFGTLVLFDPHAQHQLGTIGHKAERDVDHRVANQPLVADFASDGIKENQQIDPIQWPPLPGRHLIDNGIGDRADQAAEACHAVDLAQMLGDLRVAHALSGDRDNLVIETRKPTLVLGYELWIETAGPVARNFAIDLASARGNRLAPVPAKHLHNSTQMRKNAAIVTIGAGASSTRGYYMAINVCGADPVIPIRRNHKD